MRSATVGTWRGKRAWRVLGQVLFVLQGVLWGIGPIAEGRADAAAEAVVAHVEAAGATSCPPAHSSHDCQVGRTLGAGAITAQGPSPLHEDARQAGAVPAADERAGRSESAGALGSRAPPAPV